MIEFLDLQKITQAFQPELNMAIARVVNRGWYLLGEELNEFERAFASYIGVKYCIGVGNGLELPITEKIHNEILSFPISPFLTLDQAQKITDLVNEF